MSTFYSIDSAFRILGNALTHGQDFCDIILGCVTFTRWKPIFLAEKWLARQIRNPEVLCLISGSDRSRQLAPVLTAVKGSTPLNQASLIELWHVINHRLLNLFYFVGKLVPVLTGVEGSAPLNQASLNEFWPVINDCFFNLFYFDDV